MIKLNIEDYCQNCPDFEPKKEVMTYFSGDKVIERHTTVYCKYKDRCASIARYLKEAAESKED